MNTDQMALDGFTAAPTVGWPDRPRYLLSYAYADDDQMARCRRYGIDLIVDSGAFTTATKGRQMDHDAYLEWLDTHADLITFALSYDVIGDHVASRANHEVAQERVGDRVQLLPTWHFGSPLAELERMCAAHEFIAVGGAVPFALQQRALAAAVGQVHRIAARHGTRVHGLGMTGNRLIHGYPWYSVDSSRWLSAVRFPRMALARRDGILYEIPHGVPVDAVAREVIARYGGDPDVVATPGWSLKAVVGQELALERRQWVQWATARAAMYVEAYKAAHQPHAPFRFYLSGNTGAPPGGSPQAIAEAWDQGNPWTGTTPDPTQLTNAMHHRPTPKKEAA